MPARRVTPTVLWWRKRLHERELERIAAEVEAGINRPEPSPRVDSETGVLAG